MSGEATARSKASRAGSVGRDVGTDGAEPDRAGV